MDKQLVITDLLNGKTKEEFTALLIWGFVGLLLSTLLELLTSFKKIKSTGGFQLGFYLKDNFIRLIISIIAVIIGASFTQDLIGIPVSTFGALVMGFSSDKVIQILIKIKSNIDITKVFNKK